MLNWQLAVLVEKGILLTEEAEYLAEELARTVQPSEFSGAHEIVKKVLKDYKKNS